MFCDNRQRRTPPPKEDHKRVLAVAPALRK